ncbi:transport-associated protein [Rhizobium sp. PL01]|uniref:transport-associated protein n=1 Tax=Rhizobium sp. PL01 TaxID=3085631 RepID=UPI002980CCCB|nr:transport-associated protein [Rhizobium sp. PL01]MDW5318548.1 transport-associated protein [Rhizobium sp. PL01]
MVFIFSDGMSRNSGYPSDSRATIAAVRAAIAYGCDIDTSRLTFRMLGPYLIIEGIAYHGCGDEISSIAGDIVGVDNIQIRIFEQGHNH